MRMVLHEFYENNPVFRRNMRMLEQRRPLAFRLVLRWLGEHPEPEVRVIRSGGREWLRGEHFAFPETGEYRFVGGINPPWVLLAMGYGLGAGLSGLRKAYPRAVKTVVFEPDLGVFTAALAHADQGPLILDPRLGLVLGDVPVEVMAQFREAMMGSSLALMGALGLVYHRGAEEAFSERYRRLFGDVRQDVDMFFRNLGNSIEDTLLGVKQFAVNTLSIAFTAPLESLKDLTRGRPVVVVSAGPSLDKNVHLLSRVKGRMPILCNDVVLPKLLAKGIVPDLVCALERGYLIYEQWFSKICDQTKDMLLVAPAVVTPEVFGTFRGPKFLVAKTGLPLDERLADLFAMDKMHTGASVAHMCFNIAQLLGASPIVLLGQDLAYGEEGKTHSTDVTGTTTQDVAAMYRNNVNITEVPGALGGRVKTNPWWLMFLRQLEALITSCPCEVIDATEGGALIHGTTVLSFEEVLARHLPEDEFVPLASSVAPPSPLVARARLERFVGREEAFESTLRAARERFDRIERTVDLVLSPGLSPSRRSELAQEVGLHLDELRSESPDIFQMIQSYIFSMMVECTREGFDFSDLDFRERWGRLHREFVATTRIALTYLEEYLSWMRSAAEAGLSALSGREVDPLLARCLEMKRDWTLPRSSPSAEEFLRAAEKSLDEGDRSLFEEPRHLFPEWGRELSEPGDLRLLGKALLRWRQHELAVPVLKRATELAPEDPDAWNDLGVAYGDYDVLRDFEISRSMEAFYQALALDPSNEGIRENLRRVARRVVDLYDSALESKEGLGIGADLERGMYLNMADCLGVLREYDRAVEFYARALDEEDPSGWRDPERLINYILCLEQVGRRPEASRWADRLETVMHQMGRYYTYAIWNLLSFYARGGEWRRYRDYASGLQGKPGLADLLARHWAMTREEAGDPEELVGAQPSAGDGR
jgi:tetratricopeptide (TPR) repeat protein